MSTDAFFESRMDKARKLDAPEIKDAFLRAMSEPTFKMSLEAFYTEYIKTAPPASIPTPTPEPVAPAPLPSPAPEEITGVVAMKIEELVYKYKRLASTVGARFQIDQLAATAKLGPTVYLELLETQFKGLAQ